MRILYVLKHNPWGIGGGCYACRNYLQLFSAVFAGAEMDVCICSEYIDSGREKEYPNAHFYPVGPRGVMSKATGIFTGVMHRHQQVVEKLLKQNDYDYCIFDHNSIAGTLVGVCRHRGVKSIVLNHNCEYDYYRDNHGVLTRLLFLRHVKRNERRSYLNCDYNIFLTDEDKCQFEAMYGHSATHAVVGGCFYPKDYAMEPADETCPFRKENMKMVISGTMGNVQNMDGINYFFDELLPRVPAEVHIVLAGKNPPAALLARVESMSSRITLVPNPEDMDAVVRDCDIFLCPARLGGGMKLRVMDGFRNGLPVIAHSVSARGYREFERKGMMWEFATVDEFEKSIRQVIQDIKEAKITKEAILRESFSKFAFAEAVKRVEETFIQQ